MEFKDDATASNGEKHPKFEKKGALNKRLSVLLYKFLEGEGVSTMGAANAYTFRHSGHLITAVGEVPVGTVEMIAMSMRPMEQL